MRIDSSSIIMQSQHQKLEYQEEREYLRSWVDQARPNLVGVNIPAEQNIALPLDSFDMSDEAKKMLTQNSPIYTETSKTSELDELELNDRDKQKILILQSMIEALTGKKFKFMLPKKIKLEPGFVKTLPVNTPRQGWGLEYDYQAVHYEREKLSFASEGIIRTTDGKEINFSVQLNMSREFFSQQNISIRAGDALVDPLIINFDRPSAILTNTKFAFDLDADGQADQVSFAGSGSGFLALDQNRNGKIDNGNELFGPKTGNGFNELAQYDQDANGWIDENDPVYERLRIWTKDGQGQDVLFALGEKGIGAIYLGNVNTNFDMKNVENNQLNGQMRRSGIFLKENGQVGLIQQVDLSI